ncbi:MAG: hypothetical protein K2N94_11755 [Lachnospiraceae bacterium]|nr:hypothetical protein [Lachnospiraceae bacterium]
MKSRKEKADYFLYECGLLEELKKYGVPHIIGSYRMDMMAWNDLDIDIENEGMSLEMLYQLTAYILEKFHPVWYEAKEEVNAEGKKVWFQGFETVITGELWNFDLWFFDRETIEQAEAFCDEIGRHVAEKGLKEKVIGIKEKLIDKGLYSFEQYTSMDVYKAVLEQGIMTVEDFLERYKK